MSRTATVADVLAGRARWCVVEANSMSTILDLPDGCIDGVITDPPYSSGGAFRGDRAASTDKKYTTTQCSGQRPDFAGDTRDQRGYLAWWSLWGWEARRASKALGRLVTFSDWRQVPITSDALQAAGWIWRGLLPWDKGEGARPIPGGFRAQCEYILWGTSGPLPASVPGVGVHPGYFPCRVDKADKHHQTGKPTSLMRELVRVVPREGIVLDPFAGSGTTGVAALIEGRRAICVEVVPEYAAIARDRMDAAERMQAYSATSDQTSLLLGESA